MIMIIILMILIILIMIMIRMVLIMIIIIILSISILMMMITIILMIMMMTIMMPRAGIPVWDSNLGPPASESRCGGGNRLFTTPYSSNFHVRVWLSFQQPTLQEITKKNDDCSAAMQLFVSSEILKCRLLKWLLDHPMKYVKHVPIGRIWLIRQILPDLLKNEVDWLRRRFIFIPQKLLSESNLFTALNLLPLWLRFGPGNVLSSVSSCLFTNTADIYIYIYICIYMYMNNLWSARRFVYVCMHVCYVCVYGQSPY